MPISSRPVRVGCPNRVDITWGALRTQPPRWWVPQPPQSRYRADYMMKKWEKSRFHRVVGVLRTPGGGVLSPGDSRRTPRSLSGSLRLTAEKIDIFEEGRGDSETHLGRYLLDHLELGAHTGWRSPLVPEEPIPPLTRPRTVPVSLQSRFYDEKMGKHQISPGCRGSQNSVRRGSIPRGVPEHPSKFQRLTPADNGENRDFRGRELG